MPSLTSPILIVDKQGTLGVSLAQYTSKKTMTVLVSSQSITHKQIIPIDFTKKIPAIPDNSFSSIFIIYSGEKELLEALPAFSKKARENQAELIFVVSIFHYAKEIADRVLHLYPPARIVVVGDIFSEDMLSPQTPVSHLLWQAKEHGRVVLSNNGLELLFPVYRDDAIAAVAAACQSVASGETLAILPRHPVTQLSFCRELQKINPLLKIDFSKKKQFFPAYHFPQSALPEPSDLSWARSLHKLDLVFIPHQQNRKIQYKSSFLSSSVSKTRSPLWLAIPIFFFILALPFLLTLGAALTGGFFLKQTEQLVDQGKLSSALASAKAAQTSFALSDDTAQTVSAIVQIGGIGDQLAGFDGLIHTGHQLSDTSVELLSSFLAFQSLMGSTTGNSKQQYLDALDRFKLAITSMQTIQAEGTLPPIYKKELTKFQKPLSLVVNLLDVSPTLLGFDGAKTYLVLFQNNFELRPGGGFIGSYGLLTLNQGRMRDFTIHNVYDADGKLTSDVTPPFPLARYMGAPHWFLRDSNFDPDFPQSASQAASFLKLETGQNVDGVIGIDVSFLNSLLDVTGPISLPDYHQTLTKDNFYLLTQQHAENNFFPGSTQKQDFLRSAETALLMRIEQQHFSYQRLGEVLSQAIAEKHILFAFPDPIMQKLFSVNNLSGDITDTRLGAGDTVLDAMSVNDANIGQNKVNYYLKRAIAQEVTIAGDGEISEKVSITYANMSNKDKEFGGDYRAYVRLLTPEGASVTDVTIDGVSQKIYQAITNPSLYLAKSFKPPEGIEIEQSEEKGREVFGLPLTVLQGQTKTVSMSYTLQDRAKTSLPKWNYDLWVAKQPGTQSDSYTLTVFYPVDSKLFTSSVPVSDLGGKLLLDTNLAEDLMIDLTFVGR